MFANVRALFVSIVALRCELGVFAAFAGSLRLTDSESLQHPLADHCA